jgi:hypothetical protein
MIMWADTPLLRVLNQAGAELLGADGLWGVNRLLRYALPKDGVLRMEQLNLRAYAGSNRIANTTVTLRSVTVAGLDSFRWLNLLQPVEHHSLRFGVALETLRVHVGAEVAVAPGSAFTPTTNNDATTARQVVHTLNVSFAITNVSAEGLLLLAVDAAAADALALRQFAHPACVADVVHTCNLTALQVWLQRLEPPQVRERPRWLHSTRHIPPPAAPMGD